MEKDSGSKRQGVQGKDGVKMSKSGPGKSYRKGVTLMDSVQRFGNESDAESWFIAQRWPNGVTCGIPYAAAYRQPT